MTRQTTINLRPNFFTDAEKTLVEHAGLHASLFRYSTGVAGLRLVNQVGQLTLLPFQGQQIWHAEFYDRPLTMKSYFPEPVPNTDYLGTYGGFLLHCGMTAIGVPTPEDNHPLHGELPNADYQQAQLVIGEDERGAYLGLTGSYRHAIAFTCNYVARPLVKLYADSSRVPLSMTVENQAREDLTYMYMAHINFRPIDNGRLIYSAPATPETVRIRRSIPAHVQPDPRYLAFLDTLETDPAQHNILSPDLVFNPEVVFYLDYLADEAGWAHSMQLHPDGSADFVSHRPEELDKGVRWITRHGDQEALGLILPATAEPEGFNAEKAKGNLRTLPPGETVSFSMEAGALTAAEAQTMAQKIERLLAD